jgi:tetratricopeptide (TPR) repeat protein
MEQWNNAIEAYDYVLAIDEQFASAYFNKANAMGGLGLYEKAIETYLETFRHEDPDSLTWYYIGECYEKMERFKDAIDHYLKSVSLNDKHADAWMGIGSCYQQMGQQGLAAQYLSIAINKDRNNPEPWYMLGDVSREKTDYEKAEECYRKVQELEPHREDIWIDLHDLYLMMQEPVQSLEVIEEGLTHFPENPLMLYRKVVSCYFNGLIKEATLLLQDLAERFPKEAQTMYEIWPSLRNDLVFTSIVPPNLPIT